MSEIRSTSSYALSAIQFNSKSLNPLDSIHPSLISKIKRQSDIYLNSSQKCLKLWHILSKNDIISEHMTQNVIEVIFKQFQKDLAEMIKIHSVKQFMKIFDQDKDGCLNYDQLIQIFLFIKQNIQIVANNCLQIQQYSKFKNLMKQVRILQSYISNWQLQLRSKIHNYQLNQYKLQGKNKIDQFCQKFDKQFEHLQQVMIHRRQNFQKQIYYQLQALQEKLNQPQQYLKIKPNNRLKQLQYQQKLVSLQQRVYQALDFRKELNQLQITQKLRVDNLMMEHAKQQKQNLLNKHQKKRRQLQIKLQQMQNKLIIKMKKQYQILNKHNTLHQIQIKRLQQLQKKWASKKGLFQPQLIRNKKLSKQRNQVLSQYKKCIIQKKQPTQPESTQNFTNKFNAKQILNHTTKFKLTNRSQSQIPTNTKSYQVQNNFTNKINKYIPKSSEKSYSLCKLYDRNLQEKQFKPFVNQQIIQQEKSRKFNFMMSKLF